MITKFSDRKISQENGNKANSLISLYNAGFSVPDGFVLNGDNFSEKTFEAVNKLANEKKLYAVRSSCTKEDLGDLSFAGQYESFLHVKKQDIPKKIIECQRSVHSENIIAYCEKNNIDTKTLKMAVIIQEMVEPDYSGICFTINPMAGEDKIMLIEIAEGIGEDLVSGHKVPEQYLYDWYNNKLLKKPNSAKINDGKLIEFAKVFSEIQMHFGYPCDIEFAIKNDKLYILQARKITKINYSGLTSAWSTADFKDGGVSASVCTPFMWSLYEYIWEATTKKFIIDSKILTPEYLQDYKMGEMFFGRCYWNLSVVKKVMSQIIGYREREFDNEYGIIGNYDGDGETTKISPKSVAKFIKIALAQNKIVSEREKNAKNLKRELLRKYNYYIENFEKNKQDVEKVWLKLVKKDYLFSESTYFWQIFINTVHQSLYKDSLLKYLSEDEYLAVLGGIKDISHLRPFYKMWEISRLIRKNPKTKKYWEETSTKQILGSTNKDSSEIAKEIQKLINEFGYHSDKELDVTFECYFETPLAYIKNIKNMVKLGDEYGPKHDQIRSDKEYRRIINRIKKEVSKRKFLKIEQKITKMRKMLWWREEFRDLSTRFYYIIRIYTLELAKELKKQGILEKTSDIWMLKIGDLWAYYDKKKTTAELREIINRNKKYYKSFRNYLSDNEIGLGVKPLLSDSRTNISGLGACGGVVTATARVIRDFSEIEHLKEGDILVTKFTDTGWTPKFAIISGIVTEYGGILCHAAIVSREYGIPAIVNCVDALKKIKDGQKITIDGSSGKIILED